MCVASRAFIAGGCTYAFEAARKGQNSSSYRSHLPNWLFNSTSSVDVPDETVTAPTARQGRQQRLPMEWDTGVNDSFHVVVEDESTNLRSTE